MFFSTASNNSTPGIREGEGCIHFMVAKVTVVLVVAIVVCVRVCVCGGGVVVIFLRDKVDKREKGGRKGGEH